MSSYYLWQQYILQQQYKQLYYVLNNRQNETPLDVSGVWNTNYGRVILQQTGTIEGTINGGGFVGVYGYCQEEPKIAWNGAKV